MSPPWWQDPLPAPHTPSMELARTRQKILTKPAGSLGRLEELAILLAGFQRTERPDLDRIQLTVFAADHGVAASGEVSAFPQAVTVEMIRNFSRGGAAISVLARALEAPLEVVDVGAIHDPGPLPGVVSRRVAPGTADFRTAPAMTPEQMEEALLAGAEAAHRGLAGGARLLIGGEMGIGNTSAATAVACALLGVPAVALVGPGTGLSAQGMARKAAAIQAALDHHHPWLEEPGAVARRLGGLEIGALTGYFLAAAQGGVPVLVDGYIAGVAALVGVRLRPELRPWLLFSHRSAEPGAAAVLAELGADPLLDLGMRLGEGSGAAVAVPLLRLACRLHGEMATFAEAGVSEGG